MTLPSPPIAFVLALVALVLAILFFALGQMPLREAGMFGLLAVVALFLCVGR